MCLWCEVEERVYRSYEEQERKALDEIRKIEEECPTEISEGDECPDRPRCVWEKKLEYVMARMQKERLALEMADAERCGPEKPGEPVGGIRKNPVSTVPPHLLLAFERYVEILFDRLTRDPKPASPSRRRGRKLIPFESPGDPAR